jgi:hypothetical protein
MRTPLVILLALICIPAASAAGPWLGTATNGVAGYTTTLHGQTTVVADGSHSLTLNGKWGLPRVTLNNDVGGLSTDGRLLVLAQSDTPHPNGALAKKSNFTILSTKPLRVRETVTIKGDLGFDALSQHGRTMYLIEHVSEENLFRYRVRAFDLVKHRLISRVVADKRQASWVMEGYPVARASTTNGHWVYTLYSNGNNYPFVHALDTVTRTAVCVGIPWDWATDQTAINSATLSILRDKLSIAGKFVLDRSTFKVTKLNR